MSASSLYSMLNRPVVERATHITYQPRTSGAHWSPTGTTGKYVRRRSGSSGSRSRSAARRSGSGGRRSSPTRESVVSRPRVAGKLSQKELQEAEELGLGQLLAVIGRNIQEGQPLRRVRASASGGSAKMQFSGRRRSVRRRSVRRH